MELMELVKLAVILLLVVGNAFFVGSEIALTSARRSRINQLVETGNSAAAIVQLLHNQPERFYSVTQVGITLVSLALGAIGIVTLTQMMEPGIDFIVIHLSEIIPPKGAHAFAHTTAEVFAFIIISFLHIVGGELAPKVYAFHNAESVSLAVSRIVNLLYHIFFGFIWVLNRSSNGLLWLCGQRDLAGPTGGHFSISEEELRTILAASEREGILNPDETRMIRGVFELDEQRVREIMISRTDIVGIEADKTLTDALQLFKDNKHSRYPVYENDLDHIVGVLPIKTLLDNIALQTTAEAMSRQVRDIMLPAYVVPEAKSAAMLLAKFQENRNQMAIVIDEFGGTAGLVTLEDLVEEIIGNYEDEFTSAESFIRRDPEGGTLINANCRLDDLQSELEFEFPSGDYVTLAGLVYEELGTVPVIGDQVFLPGCVLEVTQVDQQHVTEVRFRLRSTYDSAKEGDGDMDKK